MASGEVLMKSCSPGPAGKPRPLSGHQICQLAGLRMERPQALPW